MQGKAFSDKEKQWINTLAAGLKHGVEVSQNAGKEPDWSGLVGLTIALWECRDISVERLADIIQKVKKEMGMSNGGRA